MKLTFCSFCLQSLHRIDLIFARAGNACAGVRMVSRIERGGPAKMSPAEPDRDGAEASENIGEHAPIPMVLRRFYEPHNSVTGMSVTN